MNYLILLVVVLLNGVNCLIGTNSRIQCESKEKMGDVSSILLNCTLVTINSGSMGGGGTDSSSGAGDLQLNLDLTSQYGNSDNLKIGMDRNWKTPWESIKLNYDIFKMLIWRNSRLSEIGEYAFKDLTGLDRLDLSSNKLIYINPNAFKYFDNDLIEFDLSNNQFDQIPYQLFQVKRLQNIQTFKFNDNKLIHLNNQSFIYMPMLKHVELNNCHIKTIDTNTFNDLKQLEYLSLAGNHLKHLNEVTFRDLNLRYFYVHDNLLVCDCHLRWLLNYLKSMDMYTQNQQQQLLPMTNNNNNNNNQQSRETTNYLSLLKCDQPNSLKSRDNFLDINPDSFMCDVQINKLSANSIDSTVAVPNNYDPTYSSDLQYEIGDDALLLCQVYADPEPIIYWSYGNKRIEKALNDYDKYEIYETRVNKSVPTNKTSELRIKNLQTTDKGVYTCTGEISGSVNRKSVQFNIKHIHSSNTILFNKSISNWTLLLLIAIAISVCLFAILVISFVCWKCKKLKEVKQQLDFDNQNMSTQNGGTTREYLFSKTVGGSGHDVDDDDVKSSKQNDNYDSTDDGFSTLKVNNNSSAIYGNVNSLRTAYKTLSNQTDNSFNETNSTYTAATHTPRYFLLNNNNSPNCVINGNTSHYHTNSHTLPHHHHAHHAHLQHYLPTVSSHSNNTDQMHGGYYDDLQIQTGYDDQTDAMLLPPAPASHQQQNYQIMNSLYSTVTNTLPHNHHHHHLQQHHNNQYSPVNRVIQQHDESRVPLYATLKPKQQQQLKQINSTTNYVPLSQLQAQQQQHQPIYASSSTSSTMNTYVPYVPTSIMKPSQQQQQQQSNYSPINHQQHFSIMNGATNMIIQPTSQQQQTLIKQPYLNEPIINHYQHPQSVVDSPLAQNLLNNQNSLSTSLDEDLDLNDLKDFEDVTFDNLRKPNEAKAEINGYNKKLIQNENNLLTKPLLSESQEQQHQQNQQQQIIENVMNDENNKIYEETEI